MSTLYLKGLEGICNASLSWTADTIKLTYMKTNYTPDSGVEQFYSDVSASVATGAPTVTLATKTVAPDATNFRVEFDAADVTSSTITTETDKFLIYKDTGLAATSPLIYCGDIGATLTPSAGTLGLTFNAEGIFAINDN